jgi:DNA-binding Lrp family transcriptional regulator
MAMVTAFVMVDSDPERTAALAEDLAALEHVAEVYSVAGEHDLVVILRVRRHEDLADVVTREIARLPGIRRTRTLIAFRAYASRDLDAMWSIGSDQA